MIDQEALEGAMDGSSDVAATIISSMKVFLWVTYHDSHVAAIFYNL